MSYLKCCYILTHYYVSKKYIMEMQERKKLDITPFIYVLIMITVFLLGSCKTKQPTIPAPKYQPGYYIP